MPARSKITLLPEDVKGELNKKLVAGGFSDYSGLTEWLKEQGFEIARSVVHRYGQKFEDRLAAIKAATEQARAISEAVGDEQGMMGDALTRLCQEKAFKVLVEMEDAGDVGLASLGRMVADLNRTSIAQKRWMSEAKKRAEAAVENVESKVKGKLTPEDMKAIRQEIYGIV